MFQPIRVSLLVSLFSVFAAGDTQPVRVTPGVAIKRAIAPGAIDSFAVRAAGHSFLTARLRQNAIDLQVRLLDSQRHTLRETDLYETGPDRLSFLVDAPGAYTLEVSPVSPTGPKGSYSLRIELRPRNKQDPKIVDAESNSTAGKRGIAAGTPESMAAAAKAYTSALAMWHGLGEPLEEARALNNLGYLASASSDNQKALNYYEKALRLRRTIGDVQGEAESLHNIGTAWSFKGEKLKALESLEAALALRRKAGDRLEEAYTRVGLAAVYLAVGEQRKAMEQLEAARPAADLADPRFRATARANLGAVYLTVGEYRLARDLYLEILDEARKLDDPLLEGRTLSNLGFAQLQLEEPAAALATLSSALTIFKKRSDARTEAFVLNNIGKVYAKLNDRPAATDYLQRSLQVIDKIKERQLKAITLANIAQLQQQSEALGDALTTADQAIELARAIEDRSVEANALSVKAHVASSRGDLENARALAGRAVELVESTRIGAAADQLRTSFFGSQYRQYEFYIDVLMQSGKAFDVLAFNANERSRARTLLEALAGTHQTVHAGISPETLELHRRVERDYNLKLGRLAALERSGSAEKDRESARHDVELALRALETADAAVRTTSPRYAALTQPESLTIEQIRDRVLDNDTVLLQYALGEQRSYLWVVSKSFLHSYELPSRNSIEQVARLMHDESTSPSGNPATAAARLTPMILSPAQNDLGKKRLLVVAEGALSFIPFGALPDPAIPNQPLLRNHEIVSAPSASAIALLRRNRPTSAASPTSLAVLADPVFDAQDARTRIATSNRPAIAAPAPASSRDAESVSNLVRAGDRDSATFGRLVFSRREALGIASLLQPSQVLKALDFDASRQFALNPRLADYRILHFATHSWIDSVRPDLSAIVLSLYDPNGRPEDGFLRLHDIYNLHLNADLVVLSACRTGLGREVRGEGLIGLTRGFLYAGSKAVLVSLWNVNDAATSELMKEFYTNLLRKHLPPIAALQQAQIVISSKPRWQSPYYWAGFALQGEWR